MLSNTQGLVLRNIKYGETSIISTLYTSDFGLQAYIIQGARSSRKTGIKANYFQIGQFLDLSVYHKPGKNLQYIKEVKLNADYAIQSQNIIKQSIAQYCCELILRCVKEEEQNTDLFNFLAAFFKEIKALSRENLALAPIQFTLQFASKIGFAVNENADDSHCFFDALNGEFCDDITQNRYIANREASEIIAHCLQSNQTFAATNKNRENALHSLILFLKLQIEQMGDIKSVSILHQILHD